jgi:hypothetical protein
MAVILIKRNHTNLEQLARCVVDNTEMLKKDGLEWLYYSAIKAQSGSN